MTDSQAAGCLPPTEVSVLKAPGILPPALAMMEAFAGRTSEEKGLPNARPAKSVC
jgi:hypothetical protein